MSQQSDFEDFDFDNHKPNPNMEDILDKVDKFSIDWDNFDAPNRDQSVSHSQVSDIFNKSKKSMSERSEKLDFEDSRDIMEISIIAPQSGSFRFEKEDARSFPKPNERYNRLQNLLETAKKNSLDQFYKAIDEEKNAYKDEPLKFSSYPEFKDFIKDLKKEKKENEFNKESYGLSKPFPSSNSNLSNPFNSMTSNKMYESNGSNKFASNNEYRYEPPQNQQPEPNFTKKNLENKVYNSGDNNLLPNEYAEENFFDFDEEEPVKSNPISKFNNFYEGGEKLPEKAPSHNREEDAFDFVNYENPRNEKKEKEMKKSLDPIREEKHNSFEKTFEEEKLDNLFKNYQSMRRNFEDLMGELKETNEEQTKIVTELRKLKDDKEENEAREEEKLRKNRREREELEKNSKLEQIQDEINKIKTSKKDILYEQINKKIEHLESVVRSALEGISDEKEAKMIPKVVNYYCEPEKVNGSTPREYENQSQHHESMNSSSRQRSEQNHSQSKELFTENIGNFESPKEVIQSPNRNSKHKMSKSKTKSPHEGSRKSFDSGSKTSKIGTSNHFFSPLDIHLQNNYSQDYSEQFIQEELDIEDFAEEYFPLEFQGQNKNLRNSLTQKSSTVFESFDFHVSARFSIVDDAIYPIVAAMRIGNKCSIDLYDVHVIVYGPQGPGVTTDPPTIFQEEVKKSTSLTFQVSIDKTCLEDNGFSVQISYKTDSMSKKKINFKVPLPLVQLIRPEFVYEEKFLNDWYSLNNELYIKPKRLDSMYLRSHEDVKLILPFIELSEEDPDSFSYGIVFRYPRTENLFFIKVTCFVSGKAAIQLRSQKQSDRKLREEILNVFNFILLSPV